MRPTNHTEQFRLCRTVADANKVYVALFDEAKASGTNDELAEEFRRCLAAILGTAKERKSTSGPSTRQIRNWAAERGLPLAAKGRVPRVVENLYRIAHDLPLLSVEPLWGKTLAVREWARNEGLAIGDRGRIPKNVEAAYRAAIEAASQPSDKMYQQQGR